ncbi:MAG TPA: enoyl-CoA hydratase-related protein [Pseudomonadales bacterium]|nr:enoyl-CoA hydratase-related protein [Pseudomonadales bacterium]
MSYTAIQYERIDTTALVTLNRPDKMNTWNATVAGELSLAMDEANNDDAVRAVVITGAGRAFCAGADLERGGDTFAGRGETGARRDAPVKTVHPYQIGKPVIAAINGAAVGVGMTFPMLCDIRIAAEDAKLGFVFTRRGMIPELAAHLLVQRVAGMSNAADVLMSGRIFLGKEAAAMGIVSQALAKENVVEAAMAKAAEYRLTAPASVAITKRLIWQGLSLSMAEMLKKEGPLFAWAGNQPDAKEGVMSFVQKREPAWKMSVRDIPEI